MGEGRAGWFPVPRKSAADRWHQEADAHCQNCGSILGPGERDLDGYCWECFNELCKRERQELEDDRETNR